MYTVNSYGTAILLLFITMLCWGSWGNTQKLASKKLPFQLFYWDYVIGILLFSLIAAFTLGSFGTEGRSFIPDIQQADSSSMGSAFIGGIVFNFANILLVIAIDIAGLAVAFPVGIGLALVIGVIVNYVAVPSGNPLILFIGVLLVAVAIILDAVAYKNITKDSKNKDMLKGLLFSILAGIAMGFFYRFVASAMSINFVTPEAGKLTPYSALVIFAVGVLVSNFLFNTIVMYKPVSGEKATYKQYFSMGNPSLHLVGILGGIIWCLGMLFSIVPANKASYAVSYGLGQGATMVSAAWGVFIWKEFKNSQNKKQTNILLGLMFILFIAGLSLIIISKI